MHLHWHQRHQQRQIIWSWGQELKSIWKWQTSVFFFPSADFVYLFVHSQTQLTLVFWHSLLGAAFGASHLICHLLLHDNWGNWTSSPWMWSASLLTIFSLYQSWSFTGTLVQKRAQISFYEMVSENLGYKGVCAHLRNVTWKREKTQEYNNYKNEGAKTMEIRRTSQFYFFPLINYEINNRPLCWELITQLQSGNQLKTHLKIHQHKKYLDQ